MKISTVKGELPKLTGPGRPLSANTVALMEALRANAKTSGEILEVQPDEGVTIQSLVQSVGRASKRLREELTVSYRTYGNTLKVQATPVAKPEAKPAAKKPPAKRAPAKAAPAAPEVVTEG